MGWWVGKENPTSFTGAFAGLSVLGSGTYRNWGSENIESLKMGLPTHVVLRKSPLPPEINPLQFKDCSNRVPIQNGWGLDSKKDVYL